MENIASDLKLADSKQRNLCKAYEQLHSDASSFLLLSLQWRELEEHYDSTRELIRKQFLELEERVRGVDLEEERLNEVRVSIDESSEELELKKKGMNVMVEQYDAEIRLKVKELDSAEEKLRVLSRDMKLRESELTTGIKNLEKELESKGKGLAEITLRIGDCGKEFELKEQKLNWISELIEEKDGEVALKVKQLDKIGVSSYELSKELKSKKNKMRKYDDRIKKYGTEIRLKMNELDSATERLGVLSKDIKLREEKLNGIEKLIEDRSMECDLKEKNVESIKTLLQEHEEELAAKEKHYNDIQKAVRESSTLLKVKEKELESIQNMVLTEWKDKRLEFMKKNIQLRREELDLKEKELGSVQDKLKDLSEHLVLKESELEESQRCIEKHSQELDVQEKQHDSIKKSTQDLQKQLMLLMEYICSIEKAIMECSKEWEGEENHLDAVQNSSYDHSNELSSSVDTQRNHIAVTVHRGLEGLKAKQKNFNLLRKYIEERSQKLKNEESDLIRRTEELNQKDVELKLTLDEFSRRLEEFEMVKEDFASQKKLLEEQYAELRSEERKYEVRAEKLKNEENDLIRRTEELNQKDVELKLNQDEFSRRLEEFAMVKEDYASQKKLLEEQYAELRSKERKYEVHAKKLESIEKDVALIRDSMQKCTDEEKLRENSNILHPKVKTEGSDCRHVNSSNYFLSFHSGMTIDGKNLLFFLCEHLKVHDLVRTDMAVALQTSSHPAKVVLEAMRWFYPPHKMTSYTESDVHNIKRGCILLSELLLKLSPQITPALKEEALELAVHWKDKMTLPAQNYLEVVAFLLLLANFGLASNFNADELHSLLKSVSHYKQAVELGQALAIADKYPVGITRHYLVKLEQPQSLATNEESVTSFKNEQFSTNPAERRLQSLLNEQLARHDLAPNEILSTLQESEDPAKLVLDVIQGSNHQQLKEGIGFKASSLGWCRILFEKLMEISPHISPKVREDATSLAIDWKSNIGTDSNSSLETVAFLQLLVSYGLTSSFSEDEILKLFENVKEHEQVAELWAMFGFTQKINDLVQNLSQMKQFVEDVRFNYKLKSFQPVQILDKYLQDAGSATIRACKKKETCQEEDEGIDAVKSANTCIADPNFCSEEERTKKENSEPVHVVRHLDRKNHNTSQLPRVTKVKLEQQHETSSDLQLPTNFGWQQPHPSNIEAQKLHPASQPQSNDPASGQQPAKVEMQRVHPTNVESQQPYLSNVGTPQPHSTSFECRQKRRTRSQTYEHSKMKCPRMSSSIGSSGIVNSKPSTGGKQS